MRIGGSRIVFEGLEYAIDGIIIFAFLALPGLYGRAILFGIQDDFNISQLV